MTFESPSPGRRRSDLAVLDDASVDRILDQRVPAVAPLGYMDVSRVLAAAAGPATPDDLAGEAFVLSVFRQARSDDKCRTDRCRAMLARLRRPRVAALVVAIGLAVDGGVAAIGTGSLPAPAQRIAAEVLGLAGIKVPDPHGHPHAPNPPSGNSSTGLPTDPGPPSTTPSGPPAGPAGLASPVITPTAPATSPSQPSSGATGGGLSNGGQSGGNGNGYGVGRANGSGPPPAQSGGNGNGNAWGRTTKGAGPSLQSAGNSNGNAWGRANKTAAPSVSSVSNGNGNAWGQLKQTESPLGQSSKANSNGNGNGQGRG